MQTEPAALYVRLSDDQRETGDNVADQVEGGRALAAARGLEVVRVYNDNDRPASAGSKPRPAFERMLEDAREGLFRVLVIRTTDRLYRTPADQQRIADTFGPLGIVIHQEWAGHPLDMSTPQGVLIAGLMAQVSHYETEVKRKRQKAMNRALAARGEPPAGGPVPFGYREDRLTPHPVHAQMVRDGCAAIMRGESLGSVIRSWNETGVTAPRGGRWAYSSVRATLLRPLNAGYVVYDGAVLPGVAGRWEPLVAAEDFHAVRSILTDPRRTTAPTGPKVLKNMLTNLARCGSCGAGLKPGAIKQTRGRLKGKSYPLYRCVNPGCGQKVSIRRDAAEAEVEGRFLAERGNLLAWEEVIHATDSGAALADVEARISGTLARMGEDDADVAELGARLAELKAERAALRAARPTRTVETHGRTAAYEWGEALVADDVPAMRDLLRRHLGPEGIRVMRATRHNGNSVDAGRILIDWSDAPAEAFEPVGRPG